MTSEEAGKVLVRSKSSVSGLIEAAGGWPAIIGLAAAAEHPPLEGELPQALHDFLAEELFQEAEPEAQEGLARLSLIPGAITPDVAVIALGVLEPANITVLFEMRKPEPDGTVIASLMRRFVLTAGITGVMQVATLIIMTRVATQ